MRELTKWYSDARNIAKIPLLFGPGTYWSYSFCHDVLAAFVEVIFGQTFSQYLQKHIFALLGMKDSTFAPNEEQRSRLRNLYDYNAQSCTNTLANKKIDSEHNFGITESLGEFGWAGMAGTIVLLDTNKNLAMVYAQ